MRETSTSRKRHVAYPPLAAYYFVDCLTCHASFLGDISFLCFPRTYLGSHTWILLFYLRTYLGSHTWILLFYLRTFWAEHYVREAPPSCDGCWKCGKLWEPIVEDHLPKALLESLTVHSCWCEAYVLGFSWLNIDAEIYLQRVCFKGCLWRVTLLQ